MLYVIIQSCAVRLVRHSITHITIHRQTKVAAKIVYVHPIPMAVYEGKVAIGIAVAPMQMATSRVAKAEAGQSGTASTAIRLLIT